MAPGTEAVQYKDKVWLGLSFNLDGAFGNYDNGRAGVQAEIFGFPGNPGKLQLLFNFGAEGGSECTGTGTYYDYGNGPKEERDCAKDGRLYWGIGAGVGYQLAEFQSNALFLDLNMLLGKYISNSTNPDDNTYAAAYIEPKIVFPLSHNLLSAGLRLGWFVEDKKDPEDDTSTKSLNSFYLGLDAGIAF
jgi:hypothetical protein